MSTADKGARRLAVVEAAVKMQPANDSRPVFERLRDYAKRAIVDPASLSGAEIRQVAFALSVFLALELEE